MVFDDKKSSRTTSLAGLDTMNERVNLFGLTVKELGEFFLSIGEKPFRAKQIYQWLYQRRADSFGEMTDFSKSLRERLSKNAKIETPQLIKKQESDEAEEFSTNKFLFKLADGQKIESVYIPDGERRTVCISSQVGCAVDCKFCATGWMGFRRNLTVGEIVGQLTYVQKHVDAEITNVVFMGMGEPFLNYDNVIAAAEIISAPTGCNISKRHVTISTSGIVPRIYDFAESGHSYHIAISLNATTDKVRQQIMPITRKYSLKDLLEAARHLNSTRRSPVTLEYVLLAEINDSDEDAKRLKKISDDLGKCKVNVIPYNPIEGPDLQRPSEARIERFMKLVSAIHNPLTLRRSRGRDILAACGQLAVTD